MRLIITLEMQKTQYIVICINYFTTYCFLFFYRRYAVSLIVPFVKAQILILTDINQRRIIKVLLNASLY